MNDYKFKRIVTRQHRISTIVEAVYVPNEVVNQIRSDAIDEAKNEIVHHLNDYALQEAPIYQDDMANQRDVYLAIENCINGVIEITEQLKEQDK